MGLPSEIFFADPPVHIITVFLDLNGIVNVGEGGGRGNKRADEELFLTAR